MQKVDNIIKVWKLKKKLEKVYILLIVLFELYLKIKEPKNVDIYQLIDKSISLG